MLRHTFSVTDCLQCGNQAFQNQRCLSGTGYSGDHSQPVLWNIHCQRLYRMDRSGFHVDDSIGKISFVLCLFPGSLCTGEIRSDDRIRVFSDVTDRPFGDHRSSVRSGTASHFHQPVCFLQDLCIMIYQQDRIAVPDKIMHHTVQPYNICRMQTNGRLVQNI